MFEKYKRNMIKEAEIKARYYENRADIAALWHQPKMAHNYYRKARIQYNKIKSLLRSL